MSIYIPGIAPPENCDKCTHPTCTLWQNHEPDGRHKDCPIIELPPHGRLIDADALNDLLINLADNEYTPKVFASCLSYEENAPTIIPADPGGEPT